MGSIIEVFPGSRGIGMRQRVASAWRHAAVAGNGNGNGNGTVRVRGAKIEDYAAIRALQRLSHAGTPAWTLKQFEGHRNVFPEGQLVALCDGEVVGAASSLVLQWDDYALEHDWNSVTGEGFFTTHDTAGRTLYGAELVMDLSRRGVGIARALYQAQRKVCRKLNLRRIISAARLPGYGALAAQMTPELYAQRVIWGDIQDAHLRFPMSQGFQFCGIIRDYLPQDRESAGNAALLVWLNPLFSPTEPPAAAVTQRTRKCA
jgi:GNAT superfamily N-acetyltransferase